MINQTRYKGDADKGKMVELARSSLPENLHVIDLPYRLSSWALDEPDNIGLWVDENNHLVAWSVIQTPFWAIDYVLKPDAEREMHPLILQWVDQHAQGSINTLYGLPSWYVNVFVDQEERKHELESAGFASQAEAGEDTWTKVLMERNGQTEVRSYPLPKGFNMRSLAGESEVSAYVKLHQAVFETKNMTTGWRTRTLKHPGYKSELDVVVANPDGKLVAFCIGWLSRSIDGKIIGQIEPLGCHPAFRNYALGRVALCETLRRLQQHGAESIFVETDNYRNTAFRLYESVGFEVIRDVLVYRKDYNDLTG
jgi:ribosomal protein S18 acetylase RimI-like enzyme